MGYTGACGVNDGGCVTGGSPKSTAVCCAGGHGCGDGCMGNGC